MHAPRMRSGLRVVLVLLVVGLATVAVALVSVVAASAASATLVINEVYGGGGNSGAMFTNDFIELANRTDSAVSVDGWSVQYHSASAVVAGRSRR